MAWLISQAMMNRYSNSHCSQVQVAGFLAESCSDGEPSVQSKSTPMLQAYLLHGKTTGAWNRFPSGMTFEHSEATTQIAQECLQCFEESGVDSSSVADFHAKTSQLQEQAQDSTENDQDCGQSKRESFAKYDPLTHSWRTRQRSLEGGLIEFSGVWPKWGSMQDGECSALMMLGYPTIAIEFGLLPTVCSSEFRDISRAEVLARLDKGGASCAKAVLSSDPLSEGYCWPQPLLRGVDARVACGVDRIAAIGNGQAPIVAATAWRILSGR